LSYGRMAEWASQIIQARAQPAFAGQVARQIHWTQAEGTVGRTRALLPNPRAHK